VPQLAVDRLALRLPGTDPARARRLAVAVAERLAAHPVAAGGDLGRLDVRVPWPDGATDDRLADAIADAILRAMHHAT
jgi:hypothetical protein